MIYCNTWWLPNANIVEILIKRMPLGLGRERDTFAQKHALIGGFQRTFVVRNTISINTLHITKSVPCVTKFLTLLVETLTSIVRAAVRELQPMEKDTEDIKLQDTLTNTYTYGSVKTMVLLNYVKTFIVKRRASVTNGLSYMTRDMNAKGKIFGGYAKYAI